MINAAVVKTDATGRAIADLFILQRTAPFMPLLTSSWIRAKKAESAEVWKVAAALARACETCSLRVYGVGGKRLDAAESTLATEAWNVNNGKSSLEAALDVCEVNDQVPHSRAHIRGEVAKSNVS